MADEEHLKILKQGVEAWNAWREEHPEVSPDLRRAVLTAAELTGAYLNGANLHSAFLNGADLRVADLRAASLRAGALSGAKLRGAYLNGADLRDAYLRATDLRDADLQGANLRAVKLDGAVMGNTILGSLDLRTLMGLENVRHDEMSEFAISTLSKSQGKIPEVFLRGCGLADWEIAAARLHDPDLTTEQVANIVYEVDHLRGESPIQVKPVFISYHRGDSDFVGRLETRLDERHIRYWRDVRDMKAGRLETQIDRAIRHHPVVLLVLSKESVESDWVEWEVSKARELEKQEKRDVLCPVALDDAWKTCSWPGPLRRQIEDYNILDFSEWRDDAAMDRQFQKLIDGLGMFYPSAG